MTHRYKVVYDSNHCSAANRCIQLQPALWGKRKDGKAILKHGTYHNKTKRYELLIDEKDLPTFKETALICPSYVIDILDLESGESLLKLKPTKKEDQKNVPILKAAYKSRKEWRMDPKGFFTIKPFVEEQLIRVRYYGEDHSLRLIIEGKSAEEIVQTIVRENLVSTLQHAAYLGSELMKAELALKKNLSYVQDDPLP